jgi:predicted house-cleaning noncanonical NTP pyrophosphatase (MazG superfamily)
MKYIIKPLDKSIKSYDMEYYQLLECISEYEKYTEPEIDVLEVILRYYKWHKLNKEKLFKLALDKYSKTLDVLKSAIT